MARTGKTQYMGTVVEVRTKGETPWNKFVCNAGALAIDSGSFDVSDSDPCLETGETEKFFGGRKYEDQTFVYAYTQATTSAADDKMKSSYDSKGVEEVEFRITMDNATDGEALGTTSIIPFKVSAYKHLGEAGNAWKTEVTIVQSGEPVETAAA